MTPPERSEWTVTEASKRQFGAALRPACVCCGMFVHPGLSRRGSSYLYGFKMVFGRGLCIEFLFLLHGIIVFESCAGFRLSQGRAKGY